MGEDQALVVEELKCSRYDMDRSDWLRTTHINLGRLVSVADPEAFLVCVEYRSGFATG